MNKTKARFNFYNSTAELLKVMAPEVCKDFMLNLSHFMLEGKIDKFTTKEAKIYFDSQKSLYNKQRKAFEVYLSKGNQYSKGVTPKEKDKPLKRTKNKEVPFQEIVDFFHSVCPEMPKVIKITDTRKRLIKTRLKENTKEDMAKVFKKAGASDFLNARTSANYQANIDFILQKTKFLRILEGQYDNKEATPKKSSAIQQILKNRYNE